MLGTYRQTAWMSPGIAVQAYWHGGVLQLAYALRPLLIFAGSRIAMARYKQLVL